MKQDLNNDLTLIEVYFRMHGYTWEHPRVKEYLRRCGVKTGKELTAKQVCNLVEKLREMPITDLSEMWTLIQVCFGIHGYTWTHPRVVEYLKRCGAKSRHHLTVKQVCNLAEKLRLMPAPNKLECA